MPNSDPEGRIFLSAQYTHDRFFLLYTFLSPAFDFNVGVTINGSRSYTLTSALLKFDVICDVAMTSAPNVLTAEYEISDTTSVMITCCFSVFIYPTGRIRVCKIRFVSTDVWCARNDAQACVLCPV